MALPHAELPSWIQSPEAPITSLPDRMRRMEACRQASCLAREGPAGGTWARAGMGKRECLLGGGEEGRGTMSKVGRRREHGSLGHRSVVATGSSEAKKRRGVLRDGGRAVELNNLHGRRSDVRVGGSWKVGEGQGRGYKGQRGLAGTALIWEEKELPDSCLVPVTAVYESNQSVLTVTAVIQSRSFRLRPSKRQLIVL